MMNPAPALQLSDAPGEVLEVLSQSQVASHRQVRRAQVLLMAAEGLANEWIARVAGVSPATVRAWRKRFAQEGLKELGAVAPGRGRKPVIPESKIAEIVELTQFSKPAGATQWSVRSMAAKSGVSPAQVQGIWTARGLKPHRGETFKLSTDPRIETQMPVKKGRGDTMTHDYKRNGTTTLFAALEVATGRVIESCVPKHRHNEFLDFLKTIDKEVPPGLAIHLIVDNQATHKHANVKAWLGKHPRFHLHFTPTSSSWLNLVERWFMDLTERALRRGVFLSVPELIEKIEDYIQINNDNPKPFIWTAPADSILEKVARGRVALQTVKEN